MNGDAALLLLLRFKWRGFWRKQWRRLRTPSGILLALLGGGVLALWLFSMVFQFGRRGPRGLAVEDAELVIQCALLALVTLTASTALSFRGLHIPASEIETLFAAPVSRAAMIRMRLAVALVRSAVGALFVGLGASRLATWPLYGFAGAFLALLWIPVLSQGLSILFGDAENRLAARLANGPSRVLRLLVLAAVVLFVVSLLDAPSASLDGAAFDPLAMLRRLAENPFASALLSLFWPWARAVAATSAGEFWPAFGACVGIFGLTVAAVSNLRVDFRETALATSADLAKRLARMRRGLGAGGVEARRLPLAWRTPWLFGRGPFGAIAFRKSASILRKARGGLLFGVLIIAAVSFFALRLVEEPDEALNAALMVAVFGTFYLSLGLRYDFREELDVLVSIRAWPLAPWRIFLATITPQIALVSALVLCGVTAVFLRTGGFDARAFALMGGVVLVVAAWVALDNVAFLLAPNRAAPGQDGMLQNAGRSLVLALLRSIALVIVLTAAAAPTLVAVKIFSVPPATAWVLGAVSGAGVLAVQLVLLVVAGGLALRRFDVGRDR
jgi:hypothetical protein